MTKPANPSPYTCNDYRAEMILLSLEKRLHRPGLEEEEKLALEAEIKKVRAQMGME